LRAEHFPDIAHLEADSIRLREVAKLMHEGGHKKLVAEVKSKLSANGARLKELRASVKTDERFLESARALNEKKKELGRYLRRAFGARGLFFSTYAHVERAATAANAGKDLPHVPYWRLRPENLRRSGVLAIQIVMPTERAYEKNRYAWIERPVNTSTRRHAMRSDAYYRVSSDDGEPRFVRLKIVHSRPLPKGQIAWVMLSVTNLCAQKAVYKLQFVVNEDEPVYTPRPEQSRNADGSLRSWQIDRVLAPWTTGLVPPSPRTSPMGVATVMFANNEVTAEIDGKPVDASLVNERITSPVDGLKSVRAHHLKHALGILEQMRERRDDMPFWASRLLDKLQHAKSPRQVLYALPRLEPLMAPFEREELLAWEKQEEHLYNWERCAAAHQQNARKWRFRDFAAELARRAERVFVDGRELNDPRRGSAENRDRALGDLRAAIVNRFASDACVTKGESHADLTGGAAKAKRDTGRRRTSKALLNEKRTAKRDEKMRQDSTAKREIGPMLNCTET
jgi:hypothetical protein